MTDQARFPEAELREFMRRVKASPLYCLFDELHDIAEQAIDAHDALRDRCLLAELNLGQATQANATLVRELRETRTGHDALVESSHAGA